MASKAIMLRADVLKMALKVENGRELYRYWLIAQTVSAHKKGLFTVQKLSRALSEIKGKRYPVRFKRLAACLQEPFFEHIEGNLYRCKGKRTLGCSRRTHRFPINLKDLSKKGSFTRVCLRLEAIRDKFNPCTTLSRQTALSLTYTKKLIKKECAEKTLRKTHNLINYKESKSLEEINKLRRLLWTAGIATLKPVQAGKIYRLYAVTANTYCIGNNEHNAAAHPMPNRQGCWFKPMTKLDRYRKAQTWEFVNDETAEMWTNRQQEK